MVKRQQSLQRVGLVFDGIDSRMVAFGDHLRAIGAISCECEA